MKTTHEITAEWSLDSGPVEFDFHGLVGVRLLDASSRQVKAVAMDLGCSPLRLSREPDIEIQFVRTIEEPRGIRYAGGDGIGFAEDSVFFGRDALHRSASLRPADMRGSCRIACAARCGTVPLLREIVNQAALAAGALPLHAAAVDYRGTGTVIAGWAGGGKTGTLLALMAQGARFVSDDWVYVNSDGSRILGSPEPLSIKKEYLEQLPDLRGQLGYRTRMTSRLFSAAASLGRCFSRTLLNRLCPQRVQRRIVCGLERRSGVSALPARLFGAERCVAETSLDRVLLVVRHEGREVTVETASPQEVATSLAAMLEHESAALTDIQRRYCFAFPQLNVDRREELRQLRHIRLVETLANRPCYLVQIPRKTKLGELQEALWHVFALPCDRCTGSTRNGETIGVASVVAPHKNEVAPHLIMENP